jgi:hypothetical protein
MRKFLPAHSSGSFLFLLSIFNMYFAELSTHLLDMYPLTLLALLRFPSFQLAINYCSISTDKLFVMLHPLCAALPC